MKKRHIKMVLYADPGVGKSTFVSGMEEGCGMPTPLFLCSDGNWEWLNNVTEENVCEMHSWKEFKAKVDDIVENPTKYEKYETIAVDLIEDFYKWFVNEFCVKNKIASLGEMAYGQGYSRTADEFMITIGKLLSISSKHIMILTHATDVEKKTPKGLVKTLYYPSSKIRDVIWDSIEGRCRYFLHAYTENENVEMEDGTTRYVTKRYLSLLKKDSEPMSIARGLDEYSTPTDIDLNWETFAEVIGLNVGEYEDKPIARNTDEVSLEQYAAGPTSNAPVTAKTVTVNSAPKTTVVPKIAPKTTVAPKPSTVSPKITPKPSTVSETPKATEIEEEVNNKTVSETSEVEENVNTVEEQTDNSTTETSVTKKAVEESKPVETPKAPVQPTSSQIQNDQQKRVADVRAKLQALKMGKK